MELLSPHIEAEIRRLCQCLQAPKVAYMLGNDYILQEVVADPASGDSISNIGSAAILLAMRVLLPSSQPKGELYIPYIDGRIGDGLGVQGQGTRSTIGLSNCMYMQAWVTLSQRETLE
jgi:hypothetical protein